MKTVRIAVVACSLLVLATVAKAADNPKSLADQMLDRIETTNKIAKRIPTEYSLRATILVTTAELQTLATKVRHADNPVLEDVEKLIEKLGSLETETKDLKELAEEKEDDDTTAKTAEIDKMIAKMRLLGERLRAALQ